MAPGAIADRGVEREWVLAAVDLDLDRHGGAEGRRATLRFWQEIWASRASYAAELEEAMAIARVPVLPGGSWEPAALT